MFAFMKAFIYVYISLYIGEELWKKKRKMTSLYLLVNFVIYYVNFELYDGWLKPIQFYFNFKSINKKFIDFVNP